MLLSDESVKKIVNDEVVAAWECVREVPQVTIEFADGKKLRRTLKGNTVLYLCRNDGTVIDAWPGVYTPEDLVPDFRTALSWIRENPTANPTEYHAMRERFAEAETAQRNDAKSDAPSRRYATTTSKMAVEASILDSSVALSGSKSEVESVLIDKDTSFENRSDASGRNNFAYTDFIRRSNRLYDASAIPLKPSEVRAFVTKPNSRSPKELGRIAVGEDSKTNMESVRPLVHLYLRSWQNPPTPEQCKIDFFKHLLHLDIDDPYLGLTDVEIPGTTNR